MQFVLDRHAILPENVKTNNACGATNIVSIGKAVVEL
jgi:hypothetical protein